MKVFSDRSKQSIANLVHHHLWNPHRTDKRDIPRVSHSLQGGNRITNAPGKLGVQAPTRLDVIRYRYHHGTNLGSVFVLERWVMPSMFPNDSPADQSSELAAVTAWVKSIGLDATRAKFEQHWKSSLSDSDLDFLVNEAHCTSIRLPIGYFTLGPVFCTNTPFDSFSAVYCNAWIIAKDIVARANARGIGTLIDLHCLPGSANAGDHSGTNSGKAEFWGNQGNLGAGTACLCFLAKEIAEMDGVIGLQICNEANWGSPGMYEWYDQVLDAVGQVDLSLPLYFSDGWNLAQGVKYMKTKNTIEKATNPMINDTHVYYCFHPRDKAKSAPQIVRDVGNSLSELDGQYGSVTDHGAVGVVVGEYSCLIDQESWNRSNGADKQSYVQQFGLAQSQKFQEKTGGSYFWTFKMDWMPGGDWGLVAQCSPPPAIIPPPNLLLSQPDVKSKIGIAKEARDSRLQSAFNDHCSYWDTKSPGYYEHWRFESGWKVGFHDAMTFYSARLEGHIESGFGADKIGLLDCWVRKRIAEAGMTGAFVWEFEQGVRKGIADFYDLVK